jgi:tRNA(Arg) A34 adenosine deaminase TadA
MRFAIELSRRNVLEGTGGPFGAAIFDMDTGLLVAPGINLVIATGCSVAHAEIVAIILAQQFLGDYDLGREGRRLELVASTEPCAMCYGATPWSGVRSLVCGARGEDACRVGFDEGEKPANWGAALEGRGIAVTRDVLRDEAVAVLENYFAGGYPVYNGRS